ncbi:MAG TPA: nickel pincer cofactor biosynthesis protein LarB [Thermoanaerobaculia bacterium]
MKPADILTEVAEGRIADAGAERELSELGFVQVGLHRLDVHRERRTALPEVVLGLAKSLEQLEQIVGWFVERDLPLLATKVDRDKGEALVARFPSLAYRREGKILVRGASRRITKGTVAVLAAGSSDIPVAEEAVGTLEFFGIGVERSYDCGVAGLHRLLASAESIARADVLIVAAGMEGALPSVVGGLFRQPLIAVPTSVGYGASFEGLAALLGMMNACAPGITVVNIDNGFGAAAAAKSMLDMAARRASMERNDDETTGDSVPGDGGRVHDGSSS